MPSTGQSSTHGGGWLISQSHLFEQLRIIDTTKGHHEGAQVYRPIISISGEKCYAWCKSKNALLVMNTGEVFKGEHVPVDFSDIQEWQLSQRLGFEVTNIVPNSTKNVLGGTATSVLLWGKNGLAVITNQNISTLSNGSASSTIAGGTVQCSVKRTILLGEKTYIDHPRLEVIQAKWLPSTFATQSQTVAVLNSDNYFRFYQVDNFKGKDAVSCGSICVEPNSVNAIPFINRSGRFAADLEDESVVDFGIGPCLPKSKYYPLFVLRESGCVSYVLVRFVGKNTAFFSEPHGVMPLIGYDSQEGVATSIVVSEQFPVFIAIGFTGGVITHSIVLPDFDESFNDNGKIDQGQNIEEKFIYDGLHMMVKERLDLDFLSNSNGSNSLKLVQDPLHSHRYVCIHDIGMHVVTAHFYPEIIKFFHNEEEDDFPEVTKCTYQLLLRRRLGDETKPQRDLLSLAFSHRKPQKLLCVLQDLRALVFELPDPFFEASISTFSTRTQNEASPPNDASSGKGSAVHENLFDNASDVQETCQTLLRRSAVEPYLCSKEDIPIKELEEYVMQTIQVKSERLGGIEDGMQYLMKTVMAMQEKVKKMEELISSLNGVRGDLQCAAENLAERYEECVELDDFHVKRLEAILSRYHHATPVVTDKEREWAKVMEVVKDDLPDLRSSIQILKDRIQDNNSNGPTTHETLTSTQLKQIKEELKSQSESLNALSYSLKQISEHMYYPALMSVRPNSKQ